MKNLKFIFPNTLTILNLLLGCLAIIVTFRAQNEYNAAWLIFVAAFFDLLDGMVARSMDAKSEFGAHLDSLADVVSFGIAPALILFNWFVLVLTKRSPHSTFELVSANLWQSLLLLCSLLFAAAAAIRLARFNTADRHKKEFRGMPTPAAAMTVASLWLILGNVESSWAQNILFNVYVVLALLALLIFLMVSNIKMISLKFDGFSFTDNLFPYLLVIIGIILIILFWIPGIFFTLAVYVILSVISNQFKKDKA